MSIFLYVSEILVPLIVFYILIYGFFHRVDVYEVFLKGAKEGFQIVMEIAPTMIALLVSIGVLRASGALGRISSLLEPVGRIISIPGELLPMFIVKIFSSSAAISFLIDLFKEYGPDSEFGLMASVMMSCTETVVYTVTIYFMSIHIRKTRWTLPGAIFATLTGAVASVFIVRAGLIPL